MKVLLRNKKFSNHIYNIYIYKEKTFILISNLVPTAFYFLMIFDMRRSKIIAKRQEALGTRLIHQLIACI